jgi:TetR/AcrR family transcriptional repressor of mexJK operon
MSTNNSDQLHVSAPRRRGRPRDLEKRDAILDAAGALFSEKGLVGATMEAVAERASVSKMTVYAQFPDKAALLAGVFERTVASVAPPDFSQGPDPNRLVEQLCEFGERFAGFLLRREILGPGRAMAASAKELPELALAFYAAGPGAFQRRIAAFLEACVAKRLLNIDDPQTAAEILMSTWIGLDQLRANLGVEPGPTTESTARRIREATRTLARGWGYVDSGNG